MGATLLGANAAIAQAPSRPADTAATSHRALPYLWPHAPGDMSLAARIAPPPGFTRLPAAPASFAAWLRGLPLKPAGTPVRLYDGREKWDQSVHAAVIDIDTGPRNLQQCADAIMRLRAEYLLASGRARDIAFNYTNGARVSFARWRAGWRPRVGRSNKLSWRRNARPSTSYASFRAYMDRIFTYAGTYSLAREMIPIARAEMRIGDVFIRGGFPGHAILVGDMARNPTTGEIRFLLIQSFMPAQDMHVLKNPGALDGSPWYPLDFGEELITPEWVFRAEELRRFR